MKGKLVKQAQHVFKKHGSTILTVAGAGGFVATTVMAVKATPKALQLIEEAEEVKGSELTSAEKVKAAWKPYIPAAATGTATLACIFSANILNKKQQASLVSAYALLDQKYKDYKKSVTDIYGVESDKEIEKETAKRHKSEEPVNDDEVLYYDMFTQRYFNSTPEILEDAENKLNKLLHIIGAVSYNDWLELIDQEPIDCGSDIGWSINSGFAWYGYSWLEFEKEKTVLDDGLECYMLSMPFEPTPDYLDY